jgi:hypothetical protein
MSDAPVSLQSLLIPSKTVAIDFPGFEGFTVDLCHLSREELIKLRNKCVKPVFKKGNNQPTEEFNDDLFLDLYCAGIIKGWNGLKYRYLEEFLLADISSLDPDDELVYTHDNAVSLMKNGTIFDEWVTETVGNLENFTGSK